MKEIKGVSQVSNAVKIEIYNSLNPVLKVCLCKGKKCIYTNIFNNTRSDLFSLNIKDYNNKFKYEKQKLKNSYYGIIKPKKIKEPRILITLFL